MLGRLRAWIKQYSQWFMPIILFVAAVMIFLAVFLNHTIDDAHDRAQADIVADALILERSVDLKLARDKTAVLMMLEYLGGLDSAIFDGAGDVETVAGVLSDAINAGSGYEALIVDGTGRAFDSGARTFDASKMPWYQETEGIEPGEIRVFHVEDDGMTELVEDVGAVVCAGGFELGDSTTGVCLCFDKSWSDELAKTGKGKSLMTIVDQNGKILMRTNVSDYFLRGEDYWKLIGGTAATTAKYHIIQRDSYAIYDATSNYTVIEIPMQGVLWAACVSINGAYIDSLASNYFTSTKRLVIELIISVVVFFALIIILNLIAKVRRQRESQALGARADHDQLTGLRNKAATERDIQAFMDENPTTQSILFILDIDDFKSVNDTMGHSFGDDVLHEFGFGLGSMFRASDIAGRIGGDEFMVFVKNIPNEDTIEKEAKKIRDFIQSFRAGEGVKREITASSGAAVYPADGADFETLYKSADKALYESKRSGKRQLSFFRK